MAGRTPSVDTAVEVTLEEPAFNRAVLDGSGRPPPSPGQVWVHSTTLWALGADQWPRDHSAARCSAIERSMLSAVRRAPMAFSSGIT